MTDLKMVAWRGGREWSRWHLERTEYPFALLCPAVLPVGARVTRRDWGGETAGEMCGNCVAELDAQTAKNVRIA